ncbi:hypothetical protein GCM10023197_28150 [Gordonia humi]
MRESAVGVVVTGVVGVFIGVVTVLIPNNLFGRDIAPVMWNYPVLVITAVLTGLLAATYVDSAPASGPGDDRAAPGRFGLVGAVASWFAVGCPVCNKFALMAFGYAGAQSWFAPLQPVLALVGITLLWVALAIRLHNRDRCPRPAVGGGMS